MVIANYVTLNQNNPPASINFILGGSNNYEKVIISPLAIGEPHKLQGVGENLGAVYVGDNSVNATTFDDIIITGQTEEYTTDDFANLGTDLFIFVPQAETIRVAVIGLAI
jgi:hypothetical protein